jgi:coenzyme PQQ biosynthesis protein PqqD
MISVDSRPRLAAKARLRFDRKSHRYLLLYPERGLALNSTAAEILQLCTGAHTVTAIVARLTETHANQSHEMVKRHVLAFLGAMMDRGLVKDTP